MRDGAIRPGELTAAAAEAGMTHVALTDRDGLYGIVRFAQAAARDGVVPVFGADLALVGDQDRPGWELTRAGRVRLPAEEARRVRGRGGGTVQAPDDPRARRPGKGAGWLEDDAARIILLARTREGYGDLCRTVSAAHADDGSGAGGAARSSPHVSFEDAALAAAHDGTFLLLGPDSPVGRLVAAGRLDAAEAEVRRWMEVFGRQGVLLGVRHHLERDDDQRVAHTLALAGRCEVRPVAVNDVRYLRREDAFLADVLTCVRHQVPLGRRHVGRRTAEGWFKTAADLLPLFRDRPDVLRNAHEVAGACEVDLGIGELHAPRLTGLAPEVAAGELYRRSWAGVADRYPHLTPAVRGRLERELAMIDRLGLHDYFLTVADIVADVRGELGILAACRGSAAGSLVCYALRISDVDPVAHGLAFERFMNPYRDELPDIDLDVESARREDVYDLIIARYGTDRVAGVAMVETFQARMAIREVGKVLGLPPDEVDHIAKTFAQYARARDVRAVMRRLPELKGARLDAGQLETLFSVVERIDGFPRHLAMHPSGVLLADTNLMTRTPLERSAHGYPISQFDKDDVAALGLLKLDVLAVRMLSAMRHALDLVPHTRGETIDLDAVPTDDEDAFALLRSTRAIGVFQLESPGQRELLARLQPEHVGDLVTEISLFRPGPVKADMVGPFVARRRGEAPAVYPHPSLEPVLAETYGVVVYHEQVMGVLAALTGCDLSYADLLRRQLNDPTKLARIRPWALARATDRGFSREDAEAIWEQVASFASFGFCKAHAAAFAVPTYRSAWLKAHYLPEFVAGLLTHDPGMYPRRLLLDEARTFGVAVLPVDINRSARPYTVEVVDQGLAFHRLGITGDRLPPGWRREGPSSARSALVPPGGVDAGDAGNGYRYAIRIGFQDVKGIADAEIERLLDARPFTSLDDLRARGRLSRPTAERLATLGAFDLIAGLGRRDGPPGRRALRLAVEECWRHAPARGSAAAADTDEAEQTRLDLHADHTPRLPAASEADATRDELAAIGLDVTRHVVSFYEPLLEALGVTRAIDLPDQPDWATVRVAGVKVAIQSPPQRSGQRVLFLSLDDRTGTTQTTYFERTLEDNAWTVLHAWLLVVEGRVRRRGNRGATINGARAWDLSRLWRAWQEGWLPDALGERGTPAPHERTTTRPAGLQASEFGRGSR